MLVWMEFIITYWRISRQFVTSVVFKDILEKQESAEVKIRMVVFWTAFGVASA